jgi:conjugative relaxase-like TrwC/TraI family protein
MWLVLRISKLRLGGHAYYMEVVETGVERPGEWLSRGASELGLHGYVEGDDLDAVLAGSDPQSRSRQGLGSGRSRVKVAGFDLTFCAPKSVSLLHALGEPDVAGEVRRGHREAVLNALSYVERRAIAVRRRGVEGERTLEPARAVAAARFDHTLSRAQDPHLHSHVVVANLGRSADGTWSALDGRGVYAHLGAAGALYHSQLRHELTRRLGVEWEPLDRGRADVEGIGPEVRRAFSTRAQQVQSHLAERGFEPRGVQSRRAREFASLLTRAPRDPLVSADSLRPSWQARAKESGLGPLRLEAVLGRARPRGTNGSLSTSGDVDRQVSSRLSEAGRVVSRRDVVRAFGSALHRGALSVDVERASDRLLSELRPLEGPKGERDSPGVGERRHEPPFSLGLRLESTTADVMGELHARARAELVELDRLLAARQMSRADLSLSRDVGHGLEM